MRAVAAMGLHLASVGLTPDQFPGRVEQHRWCHLTGKRQQLRTFTVQKLSKDRTVGNDVFSAGTDSMVVNNKGIAAPADRASDRYRHTLEVGRGALEDDCSIEAGLGRAFAP